jgi:predicted nucleic acid-binding protein
VALLIDTDVLIALERRDADAKELETTLGDEERAISVITVSELLHGARRASSEHRAPRAAFVEHLLAEIDAIPLTSRVARTHAEIWTDLAQRGDVIGAHDLWIAATALAHGFGVATGNGRHFSRVPGLRVVGPGG